MSATIYIRQVYPVHDLKKHTIVTSMDFSKVNTLVLGDRCSCEPTYEWLPNTDDDQNIMVLLIVHNSFDGREGVEWANEILHND